ncbi:transcription factor E4F1 [Drosophila takahashii]|uniref:transcription factor E4F1 n=1 Tax=Drosophila takahashii TaxID=29030 RepID=UPI003899072B
MASAGEWISVDLEPATLLSVKEENGIVTRVYIAPCSEPRIREPLAERKPEVFPEENKLLFHCPYCGNGIRTAGAFKVHLLACERRYERMRKEGLAMPPLQCSICKESFATVTALSSHRLLHGGSFIVRRCGTCNEKFEKELEYRKHLSSHLKSRKSKKGSQENSDVTVSKTFDCLFCHKRFEAHFKPGQVTRRYACDACVLRLRSEEGEKKESDSLKRKALFGCDRCGRNYKYEGFLNRHLNVCVGSVEKRKREFSNEEVS